MGLQAAHHEASAERRQGRHDGPAQRAKTCRRRRRSRVARGAHSSGRSSPGVHTTPSPHPPTPHPPRSSSTFFKTQRAKISLGVMIASGGGLLLMRLMEGVTDQGQLAMLQFLLIFW